MNARTALRLLKDTAGAWIDDRAPSMGAALAFYSAFSTAPLLVIVIAITGLALGSEAAHNAVLDLLRNLGGGRARRRSRPDLEGTAPTEWRFQPRALEAAFPWHDSRHRLFAFGLA